MNITINNMNSSEETKQKELLRQQKERANKEAVRMLWREHEKGDVSYNAMEEVRKAADAFLAATSENLVKSMIKAAKKHVDKKLADDKKRIKEEKEKQAKKKQHAKQKEDIEKQWALAAGQPYPHMDQFPPEPKMDSEEWYYEDESVVASDMKLFLSNVDLFQTTGEAAMAGMNLNKKA